MVALIVGIVLVAFAVFACVPGPLAWWQDVLAFLRGSLPVLAVFVGLIAVFIGIADIKDKVEAKRKKSRKPRKQPRKASRRRTEAKPRRPHVLTRSRIYGNMLPARIPFRNHAKVKV